MRFTQTVMTRRRPLSLACAATCLLSAFTAGAHAQKGEGAESIVLRGLTALHYFEYEEANEAFREARVKDPASGVACWGEAMTYHQTLWRNENVGSARQALARLSPTPAARAAKARTPKEQMLL